MSGKGFIFFTLVFSIDDETRIIKIKIDDYLNDLFGLKNIFFEDCKGYDFAENKKIILLRLAKYHAKYYFDNNEIEFYNQLMQILKTADIDLDKLCYEFK